MSMRIKRCRVKLLKPLFLFLLCWSTLTPNAQSAEQNIDSNSALTPSVLMGAYNEEQAVRGQGLYYQHCIACHGETMEGVDQAPPLAGPQFASIWKGVSLMALVERFTTMPPDRAGMLSRQENVDMLAYVLWYNGLPLGNVALGTDQGELERITFETPSFNQ